jgi:hypothetical protein
MHANIFDPEREAAAVERRPGDSNDPCGNFKRMEPEFPNMTQSLKALLAGQGISVHAVVLGPIDTDMNRAFEIPKASPEAAAVGI